MEFDERTTVKPISSPYKFLEIVTELVERKTPDTVGDLLRYELRTFPAEGYDPYCSIPKPNFVNPSEYVTELKINSVPDISTSTTLREDKASDLVVAISQHFTAVRILREGGPIKLRESIKPESPEL